MGELPVINLSGVPQGTKAIIYMQTSRSNIIPKSFFGKNDKMAYSVLVKGKTERRSGCLVTSRSLLTCLRCYIVHAESSVGSFYIFFL